MSLIKKIKEYARPRQDWQLSEIQQLLKMPYQDLLFLANGVHRENFIVNQVQVSTLINIKSGGCAEDCAYCSQSARYNTGLEKQQLMQLNEVIAKAKAAKAKGSTRFCMGAAWRSPTKKDFPLVLAMVKAVKDLGLQTCVTLGMLNNQQVNELQEAGLDYYNHNLDTSESYYKQVITTRTFQDRLDTIEKVRESGINVCSGGILGMGESQLDRANFLLTYATMTEHPESLPLNMLVPIEGTPLAEMKNGIEVLDYIKLIACARLVLPQSYIRLSAGRNTLSKEAQASCFFAGANSVFYGEQLLTTDNISPNNDLDLFNELGIQIEGFKKTETIDQPLNNVIKPQFYQIN